MRNLKIKMPALYIPHGGGPCFFMEWTMGPLTTWDNMANWLRGIRDTLPFAPRAIIVISAHWEETEFTVYQHAKPPLLFDYYGFPEHTYRIRYDAPGEPMVAAQMSALLTKIGFKIRFNNERGFDHGVFIPMKLIFPDANIPIVQLSLKAGLDPAEHIAAGLALEPLRDDGILIVGSGMSYHNMRGLMSLNAEIPDSDIFDTWLTEVVNDSDVAQRNQKLIRWESAPAARSAHPREEHLIPLLMIAGAGGQDVGSRIFSDRVMGATVSAYRFGE